MPKSVEEYRTWLREDHQINLDRVKVQYDAATRKIVNDIQETSAWVELDTELYNIGQDHNISAINNTMSDTPKLQLQIKSFDSFINKTYRMNIVRNNKFPDPPDDEWILPNNWFSKINDIVRTLYVVKYLDGVEVAARSIRAVFNGYGHDCDVQFKANDDGYYAAHVYVSFDIEIPQLNFDTRLERVTIEIQITTRIQEILRELLHTYYRDRRINRQAEDLARWKWEYDSPEFKTNYIGHVLHYIEGMIVGIRDLQEHN